MFSAQITKYFTTIVWLFNHLCNTTNTEEPTEVFCHHSTGDSLNSLYDILSAKTVETFACSALLTRFV